MNIRHNHRLMHRDASATPIRQRGVGLIEVLVAILILALGMLGMAGLQAQALKTNQSSFARSQAVMLSYYILDAMRADRGSAISLNYNTGTMTNGSITPICNPEVITGSRLTDNNRRHWIESLKISLGDKDTTCGAIHCDDTGLCIIQITWDDSRAGGLGDQRFETESRL